MKHRLYRIDRIDHKCTHCMLCVTDCISTVWKNMDGRPEPLSPGDCNLCSHCLCVCPADAIRHEGLDRKQIEEIDRSMLDPKVYETITRARRSIRRYKNKPIPKSVAHRIITLANYSPTASNSQNVAYTIITDREVIERVSEKMFSFAINIFNFTMTLPGRILYKIIKRLPASQIITRYMDQMPYYIEQTQKGRDFIFHNAPVLVIVHGPKNGSFASENCNIAASNIMNYACSMGLGSCYIGFLNLALKHSAKLRRSVQLPKRRMAYACLILGHPEYKYKNTASRKPPEIDWIS